MRTRLAHTRPASWLLAALCLSLFTCNAPSATQAGGSARMRILFIGNSYTYTNDLPGMVKGLADASGLTGVTVDAVTLSGVSLEDHWFHGLALSRLQQERWDLVIMQQGPSSQNAGRALLLEYVVRFDSVIRDAGGRSALFMVWPEQSRQQDFDGVRQSYTAAADSVHGMLFPAGEAWRGIFRRDGNLALYSADQLHPTRLGTYVVAVVMVAMLGKRSPVGLASRVTVSGQDEYVLDIPPGVAHLVQEAAAEAIRNFGRK